MSKYQTRVNETVADEIEHFRTDSDGDELMSKSEATRQLVIDGIHADRPLLNYTQVLALAFMAVAFNAFLGGSAGVVLVATVLAGALALVDGAWVAVANRWGYPGPRETWFRVTRWFA